MSLKPGDSHLVFLWSQHRSLQETQIEYARSEASESLKKVPSCLPASGKPRFSVLNGTPLYRVHKKVVWSWEACWHVRPVAVTPDLSSLKGLYSTSRPQWVLQGLSGIYHSGYSSCNYSSSFTGEHYTLLGAASYTWHPTKVILCPVFLSFCLSLKTGAGLCFCWSLPFLLVTDVQPPVCWRPRKFWTPAPFAPRDWCKVFKVKSVGFFQNRVYQKRAIFMFIRTLLSTAKLSKTHSLDLASQVCKRTWNHLKKNGFSKGNNGVKPSFYFFRFSFGPSRRCLKRFSVRCSWGTSWRGLSVNSQ